MTATPAPGSGTLEFAITVLHVLVSATTSVHVLLNKRDTRSSIGWIGLIWLSPFLGALCYILLGINRIQRKAQALRRERPTHAMAPMPTATPAALEAVLGPDGKHLLPIARLVEEATHGPLLEGNAINPLLGGGEAYPAMLSAIEGAEHSIALCTYIFNDDRVGGLFADALGRAQKRGVEIRVLVDSVGVRQGGRPIDGRLRRMGIIAKRFLPTFTRRWWRYANLRNHSKMLVVDGAIGFTGGMNILEDYDPTLDPPPRKPKIDLHFEVRGPVVAAIRDQFADDWAFSTGELLSGDQWFPRLQPVGPTIARSIADGPDDDLDPLSATLMGAISCARSSIRIVTPYFLPDAPLLSALTVAALRGVEVDILLPQSNNHLLIQWASWPTIEPLLEEGCRVWLTKPPFDHSKLFIVDNLWCLFGSANWDPRSLVLNFEFCLECYDPALAAGLVPHVEAKRATARAVTPKELQKRPLWKTVRDGVARLFSPYL
jgi:cardiolipin synthase